jgi:hypothetical protein
VPILCGFARPRPIYKRVDINTGLPGRRLNHDEQTAEVHAADLLESFFRKHLVAQRGASPATASCYRDALRLFLTFASQQTKKRPSQGEIFIS